MLLSEIEGLKFPVENLIRFFFKEGLHLHKGRVLELGCGNGNNLMLLYQYGWEVVGVDCGSDQIGQARRNFLRAEKSFGLTNSCQLHDGDMVDFVEQYQGAPFDVVLLPHSIYYLHRSRIDRLFELLYEKQVYSSDALLFLTVRTPEDYRFGRGNLIDNNSYQLTIDETGEKGCINTFYHEWEIVELLKKHLNFNSPKITRQTNGNYQNGHLITNCDLTIWGKIKR